MSATHNGFIKVWRKLRKNPIYTNSKAVHVWLECLMRASYQEKTFYKGREKIELDPGQFIMGRDEFGDKIGMSGSTVWYWIKEFESDSMVNIKTTAKGTIATIENWGDYQKVNSTSDTTQTGDKQEINTNKNIKKEKNVKNNTNVPFKKIINYLNEKANRKFKSTTGSTKRKIKARWNEGFDLDDFRNVIDTKVAEWGGDGEMDKYLRPKTLFSTKFEGYLNQPMPGSSKKSTGPPTLDQLDEDEKEAMGI